MSVSISMNFLEYFVGVILHHRILSSIHARWCITGLVKGLVLQNQMLHAELEGTRESNMLRFSWLHIF